MKRLKPIMFVGTCSDAGKSILNTAFCRIFYQDGYLPAPFKSQNMSLNSYSTPDGGEIGRAQAVQAEACHLMPETNMNPILLKPSTDQISQVVLNGKPVGSMSAKEYFQMEGRNKLWDEVMKAYHNLDERYNPIVLEGAGSISELNLRDRDIVNMNMAMRVDASVYLVADIDRGGVFASVYGSVLLLSEEERKLLKGIIINKFRGDLSLFQEGRNILEHLTGVPVVGVIPYFNHIHIEEEDAIGNVNRTASNETGKINVAVVLLKRMANFTDFYTLQLDTRFHLYYTDKPAELKNADVVILPGSKNTLADLEYIRENGMAEAILGAYHAGKKIIGICGGYQMMGRMIKDPLQIEGNVKEAEGLGLLPLVTVMSEHKIVCQSEFFFKGYSDCCRGYQIHMGETSIMEALTEKKEEHSLNVLKNGGYEGYCLNDRCWGSYMHGILDNSAVLNDLAAGLTDLPPISFDYEAYKDRQYDLLAEHVRENINLEYIYSTLI